MSKLTEFTEELVKSSQKFPSNLKRSKEPFSVKLEKDENIAFKLKRLKKNRLIEEFWNFREEPRNFCTAHQNGSRKLHQNNKKFLSNQKSIFQNRSLRKKEQKVPSIYKGSKIHVKSGAKFLASGLEILRRSDNHQNNLSENCKITGQNSNYPQNVGTKPSLFRLRRVHHFNQQCAGKWI